MLKTLGKFILITLVIFTLGFLLTIVGAFSSAGNEPNAIALIGVFLIFLSPVASGVYLLIKHKRQKAADQSQLMQIKSDEARKDSLRRTFLERKRLIDSVDLHRTTLTRNIERAYKVNDYGALTSDTRSQALEEFFASIALDHDAIPRSEAEELVYEQLDIKLAEDRANGFDSAALPFDGHAFEKWVAEALTGFGWEASVTSASGDQGIDVIAVKEGHKLGLQCKLYSSAIGNKAVQEAHAGKAFHQADVVGVISNADYTSSARDLAQATGVLLLSHHDIPNLFGKVFKT